MTRVLFLCTGNSCRSQMAEGWAKHLLAGGMEAWSAGVAPCRVDPRAVIVMAEAGIDISGFRSKHLESLRDIEFDYVVTLCESAKESCPYFPARIKVLHKAFDDPPSLARSAKFEEEALRHYRRVRDEIRDFVESLPQALNTNERSR
ncbi:MAG: arsenate reductase ArsC [Desulfobacteraceae bacterium]|nr:arsenate reductase ArsC [Desulfobacteraceae bacterium]